MKLNMSVDFAIERNKIKQFQIDIDIMWKLLFDV